MPEAWRKIVFFLGSVKLDPMCYTARATMCEVIRKRVAMLGGDVAIEPSVADLVVDLARAASIDVVEDPTVADLVVLQSARPELVERALGGVAAPALVIAAERLKDGPLRALREGGARVVLDAEASVLDVVFAFSELLFGSLETE